MNETETSRKPGGAERNNTQPGEQKKDSLYQGSTSYRLAYDDEDFMQRDELRPLRLQLELLKPELLQQDFGIRSTVVVFGSTRITDRSTASERLRRAEAAAAANPQDTALGKEVDIARRVLDRSHYYDEAMELAGLVTRASQRGNAYEQVVVTGGGPGLMEAANRGAHEAGGYSIGLNILLPKEQQPNPYITPQLCFQFHYFALRKMHFLMRAKALVVFPGGYGTLDELFDTLTLIQTKKIEPMPVLLFGREYWDRIIDFQAMVDEGCIEQKDFDLFQFVESAREAWNIIRRFKSPNKAAP